MIAEEGRDMSLSALLLLIIALWSLLLLLVLYTSTTHVLFSWENFRARCCQHRSVPISKGELCVLAGQCGICLRDGACSGSSFWQKGFS